MFHNRKLLAGTALSRPAILRVRTNDAFQTYDAATLDSTGSFFVNQLERLDPTLHQPLVAFTWSRDIDLREDVSIGDEVSSFTVSSFAASGGIKGSGKAWAGVNSNQNGNIAIDKGKIATPMNVWTQDVSYTVIELEQSIRLGTSIDSEKYEALKLKHQTDIDEQVYIGDSVLGLYGLFNLNLRSDSSAVLNVANVANGVESGTPTKWTLKSPAEILADVNEILTSAWTKSGYAVMPNRLMLPTAQYGYISTTTVSTAGSVSILTYILENNIIAQSGGKLEVYPSKWLNGRGVGGTPETLGTVDRMVAYTKAKDRVRFPLVPLQRTPVQYRSLYQIVTYYGKLGAIEAVYPELIAYRDGL